MIDNICTALIAVLGGFTFYRTVYLLIGFVCRPKVYAPAGQQHRFAFMICARNEAHVIKGLLESIKSQNYDHRKIAIFAVADNCSDDTAEVCRRAGACVYERHNPNKARKGYALEYLFDCVTRDYPAGAFDGYIVFDADNLLAPDYLRAMNDAFDSGAQVVTSYRNTKNFDASCVSAAYGIHFYKSSLAAHRPRSLLKTGTHLTGTGFLVDSKLLADGWHFTCITEDTELTMDLADRGISVAYCEAAEFYDEQPCNLKTALQQRLRWEKGHLDAFFVHGARLLRGLFRHKSFTCYDIFMNYFPFAPLNMALALVYPLSTITYSVFHGNVYDYAHMLGNFALAFGSQYAFILLSGVLTVIRERRHIRCRPRQLILYTLLYPWFDIIAVYISVCALFMKVDWKPVLHGDTRGIAEILGVGTLSKR
jgi:cellulose synthase/poly-beta-1,6-N-acetylglucosamine synthase-like glycosyltransferase